MTSLNKDTLKQTGYKVLGHCKDGYILQDSDGRLELWFCNKNHASYGIVYNNTYLEFATSLKKVYKVIDNPFNRAWYPTLINRFFLIAPSYAHVIDIESK